MQLSWYVFPNHTSFTFTFVNELSREKWKNSILRIPALTIKHVSFMYFTITYYLVMFEKKTTMHWRMREGGRGIYITIYLSKVWSISCNFVKHFLLICPSPPPSPCKSLGSIRSVQIEFNRRRNLIKVKIIQRLSWVIIRYVFQISPVS